MTERSPINPDEFGEAFRGLACAAYMVPAFLLPPAVRCQKAEAIMQRTYASWTQAGCQPSSEVNAFVFSLGASLQDELWKRLGDIQPPPASAWAKSVLKNAVHLQIMTDWLIADPDAIINLAACWLQELHRQGGVIEKADCCVNIDWHAKIAWDIVWHNGVWRSFCTIFRATIDALLPPPPQGISDKESALMPTTPNTGLPDTTFLIAGWILLAGYHAKPENGTSADTSEFVHMPLRLRPAPGFGDLNNVEMLLKIFACCTDGLSANGADLAQALQPVFQVKADGLASLRSAAIARWEALPDSECSRLLEKADALLLPAMVAFGTSQD